MTVISASDIGISFGERRILEHISFAVGEGERVGIIGVNGAGKTTLFRILCGELQADEGTVFVGSGLRIGLLAQKTGGITHHEGEAYLLESDTLLSYAERAFSSLIALEKSIEQCENEISVSHGKASGDDLMRLSSKLASMREKWSQGGGAEFRARTRSMLIGMGFAEERLHDRVTLLSGGEQTRLSLARLLLEEPDILLLDEPTNHLDLDALLWLEDFLAAYRKTVLVISHDRYFLDRVTTRTLSLEYGRATMYEGGYSACKAKREADDAALLHRYKEQQKEIARIQKNIEFQRRCGQEHNFVTIRAKQKQLARMEKISLPPPPPKDIRIRFTSQDAVANDVLKVKNLTFGYRADNPLIDRLSFLIKSGERVMLLGANGAGKSTLMKLLTGELAATHGSSELGYGIVVGYYDQENKSLHNDMTVFEEMRAAHPNKTDFELRSTLALFLFGAEDIEKKVGLLSGGERARLSLAKLILRKVNLLLLDEPTNHLDIGSREALEAALDAFDGTVIAVSHDRYFIDLLATRIIELDKTAENGCVNYPLETYEGAYDTYLKLREAARLQKEGAKEKAPDEDEARSRYEERKRAIADERNAKKKLERAEKRVGELEAAIAKIDEELFGDAASDYLRAAELQAKKEELESELLACYELLM